jgi:hypothetical protein
MSDLDFLRQIDITKPQIGDSHRIEHKSYDENLILPKLPFPNRSNTYTRFRPLDRSVESAYWDRAFPQINEKWSKNVYNTKNVDIHQKSESNYSASQSLASTSASLLRKRLKTSF